MSKYRTESGSDGMLDAAGKIVGLSIKGSGTRICAECKHPVATAPDSVFSVALPSLRLVAVGKNTAKARLRLPLLRQTILSRPGLYNAGRMIQARARFTHALDDTSHRVWKETCCVALIEIKKYDVAYYAGGRNAGAYPYRAIIGLRDDDDKLIGAAYFHKDSTTMPGADTQKASGYISCHYLAADYSAVLDILRNEKPVFVEFEARAGNIANIRTSAEPVGEGEQSP